MSRVAVILGVVCCLLVCGQPAAGQQTNKDFELLKKENEQLKKEIELLKKDIELLRKELEQSKTSGGKKDVAADKDGKPSATADGVTYVVDKVTRNGARVTLQMIATNSKADCVLQFTQLEAVDTDGNVYKSYLFDAKKVALKVNLRDGVKTKFEVVVPNVSTSTTEFSRLEIHVSTQRLNDAKEPIQLKNVRIGN
jgi:hypothetical protein